MVEENGYAMGIVYMEFLSIGDSGFLVYSNIATFVPIEALEPDKGYVWWTKFGVKWCSTGLVTLLES